MNTPQLKLFVVTEADVDASLIHGVFSSAEKAQKYIDDQNPSFPRDWQWESWTLDDPDSRNAE